MKRLGLLAGGSVAVVLGGCPSDSPIDEETSMTTVDPQTTTAPGVTLTDGDDDGLTTTITDGATSMLPATDDGADSTTTPDDSATTSPPLPTTCGNNVLEGDEVCDLTQLDGQTCETLGHMGGNLACLLDCSDYNLLGCFICGNDILNDAEDCEGGVVPEDVTCETMGFAEGGIMQCGDDCLWDTSECQICGDGIQQGFESCDTADMGGETCASLGLMGGDLTCTPSCTYEFGGCDIAGVPFGNDTHYNGFSLMPGVLPCDDISGSGTTMNLSDDSNLVVPIGFPFSFYGTDYTDANVQSNGTIRFGDASYLSFGNECLPTAQATTNNTLFVLWDDLDPGNGGSQMYYETLGPAGNQRFVVQYDTQYYPSSDAIRIQAVFHESGQIEVCYPDITAAGHAGSVGASATLGIQQNSMNGFDYSCNMAAQDGLMLLYLPV